MGEDLSPGLEGELAMVVREEQTAQHLGSGDVAVFGTPALVALMERAAVAALEGHLGAGQSTVGARIDVRHLTPTPLGMRVTARARLVEVEGRKLRFQIEAHDEKEKVGEATHLRMIIELEAFKERAEAKAQK